MNRKTSPILIIEDNFDYQFLIKHCLQIAIPKAELTFISTRLKALEHLELCAMSGTAFPKFVLLDIYLPQRETGWQLLKEIREKYPLLPVIVLSGFKDLEHIQQAYSLGAHSFMAKPYSLEDLVSHFKLLKTYWLDTVTLPSS